MRKRTAESGGIPAWTATWRKWGAGLGEGRVRLDATETAKADMAGVMLSALSATSVIISWWQQAVRQVPCCWAGAPRVCSQRGICLPCAVTPVIDRAHGAGAASTGANIQGSSRSKTIKAIRRTNRRKLRTIPQFRNDNFIVITQRSSNVNPAATDRRASRPFWRAPYSRLFLPIG
ncbi:hypothetical protein Lferr_2405 [Acidithiobacillus ferrooxidans ATCC 53993]|jgi:hypothetical protein|nr:hypothetical protein Lferr_2405 [Acidithiobacillus ferrooxidans ATCC 53993]